MGSSHFGELEVRSTGRSGSSRKGKKSTSGKPKQSQRGLGVAQLEKIRLYNQMTAGGYLPLLHNHGSLRMEEDVRLEMAFSSSSPSSSTVSSSFLYNLHPNYLMGFEGTGKRDTGYGESQYGDTVRTMMNHNSGIVEPHQRFSQPTVTLPLLRQPLMEDLVRKRWLQDRCDSSVGSSSQDSDTQELDLELKLSL